MERLLLRQHARGFVRARAIRWLLPLSLSDVSGAGGTWQATSEVDTGGADWDMAQLRGSGGLHSFVEQWSPQDADRPAPLLQPERATHWL